MAYEVQYVAARKKAWARVRIKQEIGEEGGGLRDRTLVIRTSALSKPS